MELKTLIKETFKGKSILRSLFDQRLKKEIFSGTTILDLGSGKKASYHPFPNLKNNKIITVNLYSYLNPDVLADLECPFPFKTESIDNIFAFNLLEHIYNFKNLITESYRVLKPNGRFYCEVPFLYHIHDSKDPIIYDYFRYTETMLERVLQETGFRNVKVDAMGFGPFTASFSHIQFLTPRFLLPLPMTICILFDRILFRFSRIWHRENHYPLGYFVIGEK